MNFLIFVIGLCYVFIENIDAYVILQVRKQDNNHSNVDALIHKVIPTDKVDQFAARMSRKQFPLPTANQKLSDKDDLLSVESENEPGLTDVIDVLVKKLSMNKSKPSFRANSQEYGLRPQPVQFRNGKSSMYSIDSGTLVGAVKDILASTTLRRYLDMLTKKAVVVYRAVEDQITKQ